MEFSTGNISSRPERLAHGAPDPRVAVAPEARGSTHRSTSISSSCLHLVRGRAERRQHILGIGAETSSMVGVTLPYSAISENVNVFASGANCVC